MAIRLQVSPNKTMPYIAIRPTTSKPVLYGVSAVGSAWVNPIAAHIRPTMVVAREEISMQYIDFHYTEPIALDTLAGQCCVTTTYLSSLFRKETGKTISEYIAETRIRNAILLLNTTKLPIQAIANQCGFSDANYFSRTFKKVT